MIFQKKSRKNGANLISSIRSDQYWLKEFKTNLIRGEIDWNYHYQFKGERFTILNAFLHNGRDNSLHSKMQTRSLFIECLKLIIDSGADVNVASGVRNETPLYYFINETCTTNETLIFDDKKGDVVFNGDLNTLIKEPLVTSHLLEQGANPNIKADHGRTVLDKALISIFDILPPTEIPEHNPLLLSDIHNSGLLITKEFDLKRKLIQLLLEHGAKPNESSVNGINHKSIDLVLQVYNERRLILEKLQTRGFTEFSNMTLLLMADIIKWLKPRVS